ncbi:hypothetical protein V6C27_07135 [Peptococcaceae bacterium 1198_IL3148]
MVFGLFFSAEASNGFCLGEYLLNQLGLKSWQNNEEQLGLRYIFFYALAFVVIGWWGAAKYLKASHANLVKALPLFFVALLFIVPKATELAKDTYYSFQDGIQAVEYHADDSKCHVVTTGEKQRLSGTIVLTNHSKEELQVSVKLVDKKCFTEDLVLKNGQNQRMYLLVPKHKNSLDFEFYIGKGKTIFHNGRTMGPKIELIEQNRPSTAY